MPDGTPRKLMDVSRLTALGWVAKTSLEDGVTKACHLSSYSLGGVALCACIRMPCEWSVGWFLRCAGAGAAVLVLGIPESLFNAPMSPCPSLTLIWLAKTMVRHNSTTTLDILGAGLQKNVYLKI